MKFYQLSILALATLGFVACDDINDIKPEGAGVSSEQVTGTVGLIPERAEADFTGMFTMMGQPYYTFGTGSGRADDFGFIMSAISQDAEGPDLQFPNSGYNWFSACGELTSRTPSYANPYIRYAVPFAQIKIANDILKNYITSEDELNNEAFVEALPEKAVNQIAQTLAVRAFDFLSMAPYFQFSYAAGAENEPCIPLLLLSTPDAAHNPRATVKEVYDRIITDLTWAIEHLDESRATKMYINQNVAYGLRARAYLATERWAEAAADAEKAAEGYTPASIEAVSTPSFYEINDPNWIWGYDMTTSMANGYYATSCSWIGSFSTNAYSCGVAVYGVINKLLFDKISDTDVRKGWWVDENLHSDLLSTVNWAGMTGDAVASLQIADVKEPYIPYTNVKFGAPNIPTDMNDSDWPFMRVEEMILIQAEGYAKSGNESKARDILTNFVKTYRDPSYTVPSATVRALADEIWLQRRIELWGEGFSWADMMRLDKPLVRIHDLDSSNYPDAFKFNLPARDPWMLMRFPQQETNTNLDIVNNTGGSAPTIGLNAGLRDGVTD